MSRSDHFAQGSMEHLPPEMGTTPTPDGHVRLYHQTHPDLVPRIMAEGLRADLGGRHGDPEGLWASSGKPFYDAAGHLATFEIHVPVEHLTDRASWTNMVRDGSVHPHLWQVEHHSVVVGETVQPGQIVAVHLPWHRHARYMINEGLQQQVRSGEFDDLLDDPDYGPALRYIKGQS